MDKPAILGGEPVFENLLPITKPTLPDLGSLKDRLEDIFNTGMITNSKYARQFEQMLKEYIGVDHVMALSSCTSGLMLTLKSLDLEGEVIIPSFTFSASGHVLLWNNLKPRFVDIDANTYLIDIEKMKEAIGPDTSAILAVHIFGNPCDIKTLEEIAKDHELRLIFDAAHAMGSEYHGDKTGRFGDAEVFSCSPTKLMVTGEGGIVATNNDELRRKISIGRNYGDDGSYDCEFAGINARMSEMQAILGLESLSLLEKNLDNRAMLAGTYKKDLGKLEGIKFQEITPNCKTTYKDFSIYIEPDRFGLNRDELCEALAKENIMTKKYFYPPLHKQRAYAEFYEDYAQKLPVTDDVSSNVLSLPLFSHMAIEEVTKVTEAIVRIQGHAGEVKVELKR
ncbi:MAG: DegT/DnrJ/EryC1/StrS family aminotransferase [Thermoplasmata archaeon]|nr:MAG: DegT/DnrJ/EryC1/StrS family aminotransferase [Thermoplasmata archaeon]